MSCLIRLSSGQCAVIRRVFWDVCFFETYFCWDVFFVIIMIILYVCLRARAFNWHSEWEIWYFWQTYCNARSTFSRPCSPISVSDTLFWYTILIHYFWYTDERVYQSSVYQLSVSLTKFLNWHLLTMHSTYQLKSKYLPLGKYLRTYIYGYFRHIYRYLRTYLPLFTDISSATYGHIHRYLRTYPSLLTDISTATYRHIYRYLRTYLPLLTDISSATYGISTATYGHIHRYLWTYPPLLTDIFTATYGHIYRYLRTHLPLLTDISTATFGISTAT